MNKEKRKSPRYPFRALSVARVQGNGILNEISTIANNLSPAGLGLRAYMPLMAGARVSVNLSFVNKKGAAENDTVVGRVAWSSRRGELFFAGITFDEKLHPDKHPQLYRHFKEFVNCGLPIT